MSCDLEKSVFGRLAELPLPGFPGSKSYAPWPVWSGSSQAAVRFRPMSKRAAVKLWHRACEFDRQTKRGNRRHGGAIGPTALRVLEVLLFDFLNYRSGRLDPSYAGIAAKANICERAVASAIQRLKVLRILDWVRRCKERRRDDGKYVLEQQRNAYEVLPSSGWLAGWLGYREPPTAPLPGTWGAPAPMLGVLEQAAADRQAGGSPAEIIRVLAVDPANRLAVALAQLGRRVIAANPA